MTLTPALVGRVRLPRGSLFGAHHLGVWGLLILVAVIVLLVYLNQRRR
ncbi:MAG: hypothetical protein ABJA93_13560 [Sporichthyaceae bacterium]